jgi:hypothetical protein
MCSPSLPPVDKGGVVPVPPPGGPRFPGRVLSQRRVLAAGWPRAVDPLRPVGVRVHHQPVHRPGQAVGPVERTLSLGVGRPARRAKLVRVYLGGASRRR